MSERTKTTAPERGLERECELAERECLASLRGRWHRLRGDLEGVVQRHPKAAIAVSASVGAVAARLAASQSDAPAHARAHGAEAVEPKDQPERQRDTAGIASSASGWIAAWLPSVLRWWASTATAPAQSVDPARAAAPASAGPAPPDPTLSEAVR